MTDNEEHKIVMLCGGVGGARAALALYQNLPPENLTFVVNTGDDFCHLGLEIWPDWDTVVYHLAGVQDTSRGWGRQDEGTRAMEEIRRLGGPDWFHLGDRDLALHVFRTWALSEGRTPRQVCREICRGLNVEARVLPLCANGSRTRLRLADGRLMDFQDWFVGAQGKLKVTEVVTEAAEDLSLTDGVEQALTECDLIVFAPSNPYLSLGPMLANRSLRKILKGLETPRLAVSPLIGGRAVKGPLDGLIESLSPHRGQEAIAHYWAGKADALLLPEDELKTVDAPPLPLVACHTLLKSSGDRDLFCHGLLRAWRGLE